MERLEPSKRVEGWREFRDVWIYVNDKELAVKFAKRVIESSDAKFEDHKLLARLQLDSNQTNEAIVSLQWCLTRKPNDATIADWLKAAYKQRTSNGANSQAPSNSQNRVR